MNLASSISDFLDYILCFKSSETHRFYKSHLLVSLEYFNDHNIFDFIDIDLSVIKKFIKFQKYKKLQNSTINKRILCLKKLFKYYDYKFPSIEYLPEVQRNFNYLTYYEIVRLLNFIENSNLSLQNKLMLRLFLDTGCRLTELLNIKIPDIDLINNCILLSRTKTNKERYVFFTDEVKKFYLVPYLKNHSGNLLFYVTKNGVQALFFRVKNSLNFRKFSPHMMRHTYATILINNNTNLEFIRCTLGHSSLNTTKRYLHYNQEQLFKTYKEQFKIKE